MFPVGGQVPVEGALAVQSKASLGVPDGPSGRPLVERGAGEQLVGLDHQLGVADPEHLGKQLLRNVVAAAELVDTSRSNSASRPIGRGTAGPSRASRPRSCTGARNR
jgi:hypothetical protein